VSVGLVRNGVHNSTRKVVGNCTSKPGGMTPTMVKGSPLKVTLRPATAGSPPNRRCQSSWEMMATRSVVSFSSSTVNVRPSAGCTPRVWKKLKLTAAP
jgi:hypothetical protein